MREAVTKFPDLADSLSLIVAWGGENNTLWPVTKTVVCYVLTYQGTVAQLPQKPLAIHGPAADADGCYYVMHLDTSTPPLLQGTPACLMAHVRAVSWLPENMLRRSSG